MNPRSVTRATLANPIFWLALGALAAGQLIGADSPWWCSTLAAFGIAAATNGIERWYVTARAKAIVTQGIVDAAAIRPDVFWSEDRGSFAMNTGNATPTVAPPNAIKLCVHAPWAGGCTRAECR